MTSELIDVTAVEVLHDRVLRLTFETGEVRDVDVAPLLWGAAFAPLRDDAEFRRVQVDPEARTIVWPNGADLSATTLYQLGQPVTTRSAG
jgi:hypothetical protein